MLRRILVNIALAFILFPATMLLTGYVNRYIIGDYSSFSGSFGGFTYVVLSDGIRGESWWLLLGVLLPYNTIVYYYRRLREKEIRLIYKILIFLFNEFLSFVVMGAGGYFFASLVVSLELVFFFLIIAIVIVLVHEYFLKEPQ